MRMSAVSACLASLTAAGLAGQLPEHELEDPAVAEVAFLIRSVDPDGHRELAIVGPDGQAARERIGAGETGDGEPLAPGQRQRVNALALVKLERQDSHSHQVRA